jgi:hypothetical protein
MIWWDHYAWRKNRKYVKGSILLGKINIKLSGTQLGFKIATYRTVRPVSTLSNCLAKIW